MDKPSQTLMPGGVPVRTLLVALCCVLVSNSAWLSGLAIYDRAAILDGAWWRLLSGHLVHFSTQHLFVDLACVLSAGWYIESQRDRGSNLLFFSLPPVISLGLLLLEPELGFFGGMSGVACGLVVYAGLLGLRETGSSRAVSSVLLCLLLLKMVTDALGFHLLAVPLPAGQAVPVASSHLVGALAATAIYCLVHLCPSINADAQHPSGVADQG